MHIKTKSCTDPSITKSVFRNSLHRAHTMCSKKYIKEETQFLIDMFIDNGHRTFLENLKTIMLKRKIMAVAITPS